jgi:hypothetical protein
MDDETKTPGPDDVTRELTPEQRAAAGDTQHVKRRLRAIRFTSPDALGNFAGYAPIVEYLRYVLVLGFAAPGRGRSSDNTGKLGGWTKRIRRSVRLSVANFAHLVPLIVPLVVGYT